MALSSIEEFCGLNPPGLYTIEYVETNRVDADVYQKRLDAHIWTSGIPFRTGTWLKAPVFLRPDQLWTQTPRETTQGRSYVSEVNGATPQLRVEVEAVLEAMANHPFILRLLDHQQKYWLLGTLEHPYYFQAPSTSGSQNQRGQYNLRWESEQPQRAYGFQP
jgi:hypothetical protein